ncbi:MAG: dihydrodipicolinate synthase family protein [Pseudomonadota bacterium]
MTAADLRWDPLWVPILTHYEEGAGMRLDRARQAAQIAAISPHVRQYLIAGTTGDGWEMSDETLADWLDFAATGGALGPGHSILVGAFAGDTAGVIARAQAIEAAIAKAPLPCRWAGLTICAPVKEGASQEEIADHLRAVIAATTAEIAIYQLPQVVNCEIAPATFAAIAAEAPRVTLFKDTSGGDAVAKAGLGTGGAKLLRGAEGGYAGHLKPNGAYDGWLLSTANGLAPQLRAVAEHVAAGRSAEAGALSDRTAALVEKLFEAAGRLPAGNPFANANRAVDHVLAHGPAAPDRPARIAQGGHLPDGFIRDVAAMLSAAGIEAGPGYLAV